MGGAPEQRFIDQHPDDVVHVSGAGEVFVRASAAERYMAIAIEEGWGCLGIEGFLIESGSICPSSARIADFSDLYEDPEFVVRSWASARELLANEWADPPAPEPMTMSSGARGEYSLSFTIAAADPRHH